MYNDNIMRSDLLTIADLVAKEKNINREHVLEALEMAIQKAARSKYGFEKDLRATISRRDGSIALARYLTIVEEIENSDTEILLEDVGKEYGDKKIGDEISDSLPPLDFGRIAAQTAKQVIIQRVREIEREKQYEEYKDRIGEIINCQVKRIEYGNIVVDLEQGEALLRRDEVIPREHIKRGDRIRVYIMDVRRENRGPQVFLSRTHPHFMAMLFAQEVPEIYDGVIQIMAASRDPGSRGKIAVRSLDPSIDPVGACVGMRGSRVQAVVGELQGEKIDIVPFEDDVSRFLTNAITPASVTKVIVDEQRQHVDVVVSDDQLSLAIGRNGQNVRLASILTGYDIDVLTEDMESERRQQEISELTEHYSNILQIDDVIARLLLAEGYMSIEVLAETSHMQIARIDGINEDFANTIITKAQSIITEREEKHAQDIKDANIDNDLLEFEGLNQDMLLALANKDIRTLEDFAGLSGDEIISPEDGVLRDFNIDNAEVEEWVLRARVLVGWLSEDDYHTMLDELEAAQQSS